MKRHKSKYSTKRKKKYVAGGMYADNTVQSAGQGSAGVTANIVFQESNPAVLDSKLQQLQDAKNNAVTNSDQMASEVEQQDQADKQSVALAEQESNQKFQAGENIAKQGMEAYDKFQKGAGMLAANKLKGEATKKAAQSIAGEGFGNIARKKGAEEVSSLLASQAPGAGAAPLNLAGGSLPTYGLPSVAPPPIPGVVPPPPVGSVATSLGKDVALKTGAELGTKVGTEAVKGAGKFAGVGGAGAAGTSGLAKFATSGAGLGTIASLAGMGISKLSDDGDATKSNFGEYSGSILSSAGTGAGIGSLLGPVGTAVGAGIAAIYGAGKQFFGTRKAKREEAKLAKVKKKKVDKYNKELTQNLASATAQAKAGEIEQKTYSGYDLGRNVVARQGGMRLGMPRYA